MYHINEPLIRKIHTLHGMSQRDFSTFAFDSLQFFPHRLCSFELFNVVDIIKMANATHIPIRYFFCDAKEGRLYNSLSDIKKMTNWKDITINIEQLKKVSLGDGYPFSRSELIGYLNIDASCFWRWIYKSFKMRAQMLCDMCNEFGINMGDIINDENEPIPQATTDKYGSKTKEKSDKTIVQTKNIQKPLEPEWQWQSCLWGGDYIPTLADLIGYCNRQRITILPFLSNPKRCTHNFKKENSNRSSYFNADVSDGVDSTLEVADTTDGSLSAQPAFANGGGVSLDYMSFAMLMRALGMSETPDTISVVKFCQILQENYLSPACCINDPNAHYPISLLDRMVRALGNAGITV